MTEKEWDRCPMGKCDTCEKRTKVAYLFGDGPFHMRLICQKCARADGITDDRLTFTGSQGDKK